MSQFADSYRGRRLRVFISSKIFAGPTDKYVS
jgi:hypothetical protein